MPRKPHDDRPTLGLPLREPAAGNPLTIVRLTAENVKRLRAVTITPDGNLVVLSGRNAQGKSSVLDAIEYALGGKPKVAEPVRRGEDSAQIVCDLGDIIVRRRFIVGGNTTLEVTSREGLRYPSPQKILDDLVGRLSFDPLAFARMEPKAQRETLHQLLGLDFAEDERRAELVYNERTIANRELKAAQARLQALPKHADAPDAPLSAADVAAEMHSAQATNNENAAKRRRIETVKAKRDAARDRCAKLRDELEIATATMIATTSELESEMLAAAALVDIDVAPLTAKLGAIDQTNAKVRANQQHDEVAAQLAAAHDRSVKCTEELECIESAKAKAIAAAQMPVPGLGFGDGGVTLNGIPLEQGSGAEQLRVSVAIGLAMNPRLRVLLIRDAAILDTESLRLVGEMAHAAGAQVWCETVTDGEAGTGIVIEDGMVKP